MSSRNSLEDPKIPNISYVPIVTLVMVTLEFTNFSALKGSHKHMDHTEENKMNWRASISK